ncbi:hypothetical protein BHM03_00045283 [Ensete ventricosum]|nr:hypothetical protein BHM03_00045283 [Ensete ventricosum]
MSIISFKPQNQLQSIGNCNGGLTPLVIDTTKSSGMRSNHSSYAYTSWHSKELQFAGQFRVSLEAAHEREKELMQEIAELQWR